MLGLRLKGDGAARLERLARRLGRSAGESAALLLDEQLKEEELPFIELRSSLVG